jgi:hypothetical protein
MLRKGLRTLAGRSALGLWREGSIPSHSLEDILGIFSYGDFEKQSSVDALFDQLRRRIMGVSPLLSLQFLIRFSQIPLPIPADILDDLVDCLQEPSDQLHAHEYVRGMELASKLTGPHWDPLEFINSKRLNQVVSESAGESLVRLCGARLSFLDSLKERAISIRASLSALQQSKLAFYTGEEVLLPCNPASIEYSMMYSAAWNQEIVISRTDLESRMKSLSAKQAQNTLWALRAMQESPPENLSTIAESGVWKNMSVKHECMLRIGEDIPFPVRIPQVSLKRRQSALIHLQNQLKGHEIKLHVTRGGFMYDFTVNGKYGILAAIPHDPFFKIHSRFLPQDALVVHASQVDRIASQVV